MSGIVSGLLASAPLAGISPAEAQYYPYRSDRYYADRPANRWMSAPRGPHSGYYVPPGYGRAIIYDERAMRPRTQQRGGDPLARKAAEDLRKAPAPPAVKGPLLIAVSIASQTLTLYDNGVPIARSPVSTGTASHRTPTGVFSIIQKRRFHRSNLYSNAPMPFMQRLTWSGIALHAGHLPGYPASHGCIRLPNDFAVRLFQTTKMGARVIVSHDELTPAEIAHERLFRAPLSPAPKPDPAPELVADAAVEPASADTSSVAADSAAPDAGETNKDEDTASADAADPSEVKVAELRRSVTSDAPRVQERKLPDGPVSVFISRKDQRLYVRKGFEPIFETPIVVADAERLIGTHVFTAMSVGEGGATPRWTVVSVPDRPRAKRATPPRGGKPAAQPRPVETTVAVAPSTAAEALNRIDIPEDAQRRISEMMSVGAALIVSDQGLGPETGQGTEFVVLTR